MRLSITQKHMHLPMVDANRWFFWVPRVCMTKRNPLLSERPGRQV